MFGIKLQKGAMCTHVLCVWKGIFIFTNIQMIVENVEGKLFLSDWITLEVLWRYKIRYRRLRFLVTVPPLYGPGFHFIVLDDISLVAKKPNEL